MAICYFSCLGLLFVLFLLLKSMSDNFKRNRLILWRIAGGQEMCRAKDWLFTENIDLSFLFECFCRGIFLEIELFSLYCYTVYKNYFPLSSNETALIVCNYQPLEQIKLQRFIDISINSLQFKCSVYVYFRHSTFPVISQRTFWCQRLVEKKDHSNTGFICSARK